MPLAETIGETLIKTGILKRFGVWLWGWSKKRWGRKSIKYLRHQLAKAKAVAQELRAMKDKSAKVLEMLGVKEAQIRALQDKLADALDKIDTGEEA